MIVAQGTGVNRTVPDPLTGGAQSLQRVGNGSAGVGQSRQPFPPASSPAALPSQVHVPGRATRLKPMVHPMN